MSSMTEYSVLNEGTAAPRLTFAIPYRSHPRYLVEAVESVLAQTSPNWLLRIYDDNPTQPLDPGILAPYLADSRIDYAANPLRLGMGGNWNQCLDKCSTELLTILHADDVILPNYLQLMLDAFDGDDSAWAVFCRAEIMDRYGQRAWSLADEVKRFLRPRGAQYRLSGEAGADALLRGNFIICPTVCYHLGRVGGRRFDSDWRMVLDLDFYLQLLLDGGVLLGCDELAYRYRRHPDNQTARLSVNLQRFEEEVALYRKYANLLEKRSWSEAAVTARRCRIVKLHLLYLAAVDMMGMRWRSMSSKLALLHRI
jgi:glycosyltransferase involved in cell wall biosynthesis